MPILMKDLIIKYLFSTRLTAVLFLLYPTAMGLGTFIETWYSTDTAKIWIYNAWWFELLDYINDNIRCNCISPARVHTPFVDGFIRKNYPGEEKIMFDNLSKTQPIGRMGKPQEIADLALYLSSDEASFITGSNFPIDGGFVKLNSK